jgi:hypothetical protein
MKITNWKDCIINWTKWKKLVEKAKSKKEEDEEEEEADAEEEEEEEEEDISK